MSFLSPCYDLRVRMPQIPVLKLNSQCGSMKIGGLPGRGLENGWDSCPEGR